MFAEKNSDGEKKETTGAVLVAISIPIFTTQLEKSRDTTTVANLRSAYAEAQAAYLTEDDSAANVTIKKTANKITSIEVANVVAQGVQEDYQGDCDKDLPFAAPDNMGGTAGKYTVTFTYADDGTVGCTATKAE